MAALPLDVLNCIFAYLLSDDRSAFRRVCRRWRLVMNPGGLSLSDFALRCLDANAIPSFDFAKHIHRATLPNQSQERTEALLAALSRLPELHELSIPLFAITPKTWLPKVTHLSIEWLQASAFFDLSALRPALPALRSLAVNISSVALGDAVPRLTALPITRLALHTNSPAELPLLLGLAHLTDLDYTVLNLRGGACPDFSPLHRLRALSVTACETARLDASALPIALTSLTVCGDRLEIARFAPLPPTLERLATNSLRLVSCVSAPSALRTLEVFVRGPRDDFAPELPAAVARLAGLTSLTLPFSFTPDWAAALSALTRLETLGAATVAADLACFPRLRTLRLRCAAHSLPPPVPQVRALSVASSEALDEGGLQHVAKWTQLRDVSLKGQWGYIAHDEWRRFAAAMRSLLSVRLYYAIRSPPRITTDGAIAALGDRRLYIEM